MKNEVMRIRDVTSIYREQLGVSQDKFASMLIEDLVNIKVTRQAVSNWEMGQDHPSTDFLLICSVVYKDWRSKWAIDCLKVKLPEVFDSGIVTFKLPTS
jgi:DNA-binding transcriptional regulator YiaG